MGYEQVIDFWFVQIKPRQWWLKDPQFDAQLIERFGQLHQQATMGNLAHWRDSILGRLAEIILLDQFSRNFYRGEAKSFQWDDLALELCFEAIATKQQYQLTTDECQFLYMPLMHSESLDVHNLAMALFKANGNPSSFEYEKKHRDIIARFSRFPHRNSILGRQSSPLELEFLRQPGSRF